MRKIFGLRTLPSSRKTNVTLITKTFSTSVNTDADDEPEIGYGIKFTKAVRYNL